MTTSTTKCALSDSTEHERIAASGRNPMKMAYVGLALTIVCWGLVPVFQKQLLEVFGAVELTFVRFFVSGFVLLGVVLVRSPRELSGVVRRNPWGILLSSVLGPLLAMVSFNFGVRTVAISLAALVIALEPMLTYVIAVAMGQERWELQRVLSILLCLAGLAVTMAADGIGGGAFWVGLLAVFVTPIVWAVNTVISKGLVEKESPIVIIVLNFLISSALLLPFSQSDGMPRILQMSARHWGALAFCVLPGTVMGYTIWYWALRFLSPSTLSISLYAIPIISVVGGVVVLGESLTIVKGSGVALVLYGLYRVNTQTEFKRHDQHEN
ncbi:DMT family transporter [Sorangium sp. So ce321]|uniref:DMT family transporter n=1 Tax=Sorangium sp. So ce321 TaxID=3133300 RepID=UPI003F5FAE39